MTEPHPPSAGAAKKPRKPKPPAAVKGKIDLGEFRDLLERCVNHRELFNDTQVRFLQSILQAIHQDPSGVIRVTLSPLSSTPRPAKPRFTKREFHIPSAPGDDEVRATTRDIALITDEAAAFERIDGLAVEFLHRAAALFGFKADSLVGLKSAFASVVSDIRQMENIAASRPKGHDSRDDNVPVEPKPLQ